MSDENGYSLERLIGAIEARTTINERRISVVENDIKQELRLMNSSINSVQQAITSARGGWRALAWLTGAVSMIGGASAWVVHIFFKIV